MKKIAIIISISIMMIACSNNQAVKKSASNSKVESRQVVITEQAIETNQPEKKESDIKQMLDRAKKAIVDEDNTDIDFAITTYTNVLKIEPNNGDAFYGRGTAYAMKRMYEESVADLENAIKIMPNNTMLFVILAEVYTIVNRKDDAISMYSKVLEMVSDSNLVYRARASVYAVMGKTNEALEDYNKAIELYPYDVLSFMGRAMILFREKKYDKAIDDFTAIININPKYADALYWLSICYYTQEKYEKTIEMITTLINYYNVENAELYNDRGDSYKKIKEYDKALIDLENALKLDIKFVLAYITSAEVYAEIGNEEKVFEYIEKALKIDADSKKYLTDEALKKYVESERGKRLINQY